MSSGDWAQKKPLLSLERSHLYPASSKPRGSVVFLRLLLEPGRASGSRRSALEGLAIPNPRGLRLALLFHKIMRQALQILAVEDEKAVAQILAVVLGGPMAKVARASDGWEALIKIGASPQPFDVVITDHRMPRMGGLELVRQLRARNFRGKILVLSAHLADEDIQAYEELKVDMMMSKPFNFDEIQNAVAVLTKGASIAIAA